MIKSVFCPQNPFMDFMVFSEQRAITSVNSIKQLILVMEKCYVFFAVGSKPLNII
jgi:hypothetical protein